MVSMAGYGNQVFEIDQDKTETSEPQLQLTPTGRIEGRLGIDQPELTRGLVVSVTAYCLRPGSERRSSQGVATATVDEQGRFVIPEIAAGPQALEVNWDPRLAVRPRLSGEQIFLDAGETLKLEIPVEPCVRVHGVVLAKDTGRPMAGVPVAVNDQNQYKGFEAVSDEHGRFSGYSLAGNVTVQIGQAPDNYVQLGDPRLHPYRVPADKTDFDLPPLELVPQVPISGKLLGPDGKPLAGAMIHAKLEASSHTAAITDEKGAFTIMHFPAGLKPRDFFVQIGDAFMMAVAETTDPLVGARGATASCPARSESSSRATRMKKNSPRGAGSDGRGGGPLNSAISARGQIASRLLGGQKAINWPPIKLPIRQGLSLWGRKLASVWARKLWIVCRLLGPLIYSMDWQVWPQWRGQRPAGRRSEKSRAVRRRRLALRTEARGSSAARPRGALRPTGVAAKILFDLALGRPMCRAAGRLANRNALCAVSQIR